MPTLPTRSTDTIITVDCQHLEHSMAAAYLILEGERAAFVDNGTAHSVPHLIAALEANHVAPEQVELVIITHMHLDHAGGTSGLMNHCPNAIAVAHPRAEQHLVDPSRLIKSSKRVYGKDLYIALHGDIGPVAAERVRTVDDGETINLGERPLTFYHTPGHAKHHICIHDPATGGIFTGDTFGLCYPELSHLGTRPYLSCATPPTDFDPNEARKTVNRIVALNPERAYLTHFGEFADIEGGSKLLLRTIDNMENVFQEALDSPHDGDDLDTFCQERVQDAIHSEMRACGIELTGKALKFVAQETWMNTKGIAYAVHKARSAQT